jgi:predicted kinase
MRLAVLTVGKTHSGKTTFARMLEKELPDSVVIDQDLQAEFINTHYRKLVPRKGPNTFKMALSQTILNHAVEHTGHHIILSNSNLDRDGRHDLLSNFKQKGFKTILIDFQIPEDILYKRIEISERNTTIFRTATSYEEVLERQKRAHGKGLSEGEAGHLLTIRGEEDVPRIIEMIKKIESIEE